MKSEESDTKTPLLEKEKVEKKSNVGLICGLAFIFLIAIPFVYYSIRINIYAQKHQPEGFNFPHILDFWRVVVGAVVAYAGKMLIAKLTFPIAYSAARGGNDEKTRLKYAHKIAENCGSLVQYVVVSIWGYIVLKDSNFMPRFMGG